MSLRNSNKGLLFLYLHAICIVLISFFSAESKALKLAAFVFLLIYLFVASLKFFLLFVSFFISFSWFYLLGRGADSVFFLMYSFLAFLAALVFLRSSLVSKFLMQVFWFLVFVITVGLFFLPYLNIDYYLSGGYSWNYILFLTLSIFILYVMSKSYITDCKFYINLDGASVVGGALLIFFCFYSESRANLIVSFVFYFFCFLYVLPNIISKSLMLVLLLCVSGVFVYGVLNDPRIYIYSEFFKCVSAEVYLFGGVFGDACDLIKFRFLNNPHNSFLRSITFLGFLSVVHIFIFIVLLFYFFKSKLGYFYFASSILIMIRTVTDSIFLPFYYDFFVFLIFMLALYKIKIRQYSN